MSEKKSVEERFAGLTQEQEDLLFQISREVHAEFGANAHKEVFVTPTMKKLAEKAMVDPDIPPEKRAAIKNLYDQGEFTKTNIVTSRKAAKRMEAEIQKRINQAIKDGLLPKLPGKPKKAPKNV